MLVPSNFADTNVGQFAFTVVTPRIADWLRAGKMGVIVVILVLPSCEAFYVTFGVTNVAVLCL